MGQFLEDAQELYNKGKWPESNQLIDKNFVNLTTTEETAEANRLQGWNWYYIGIKGLDNKQVSLEMSKAAFQAALSRSSDSKKRTSILNGLPLSLWILGEQKEAWQVSDQAVKEFPDEPSIWNTRSILCRWAKDFKKSIEVCEKTYETSLARQDYRTAGHAKQNRADALKELGRTEEARQEYQRANELYGHFEEITGQSAKFHIEGVEKKLASL